MKKEVIKYSVTELCNVFNVSMSSYYYKSVLPNLVDINFITLIKAISNELHILMHLDHLIPAMAALLSVRKKIELRLLNIEKARKTINVNFCNVGSEVIRE
tara:strand:- start:565 stop:867 length:303 start_codon:yes stop_codon:yes gene_type:complete